MSDTTQFRVLDFDCPTCASNVERALRQQPGVESVEVHYTTGRVEITYDPGEATPDAVAAVIEKQGYTPTRA